MVHGSEFRIHLRASTRYLCSGTSQLFSSDSTRHGSPGFDRLKQLMSNPVRSNGPPKQASLLDFQGAPQFQVVPGHALRLGMVEERENVTVNYANLTGNLRI